MAPKIEIQLSWPLKAVTSKQNNSYLLLIP